MPSALLLRACRSPGPIVLASVVRPPHGLQYQEMRVLLYTRAFWPNVGGIESFLELLAGHVHGRGGDVTVVAENEFTGDSPFPFPVYWRPDQSALHNMVAMADVLHLNVMKPALRFRALVHGTKVVTTYHDVTPICPKGVKIRWNGPCNGAGPAICLECMKRSGTPQRFKFLVRPVVKSVLSLFGHANVVSTPWADARFPLFHRSCIPNFIDADRFAPPVHRSHLEECPRAIFVGRFVEEKGIHVLLEALRICRDRGSPFELILCGGGGYEDEIRRQIDAAELTGWIEMRGLLAPDAVAAALREADFAVVPSVCYETFGIVAGEAMATGLPVIVTDAGGLEDVAGEVGIVVERGSAEQLATAIETLLSDAAGRKEMGSAGRARVLEEFNEQRTLGRYVKLYTELTGLSIHREARSPEKSGKNAR